MEQVKLSCLPVSLFPEITSGKMSIPQWAAEAKKLGLDGFDISVMFLKNHTPVYLRGLKEQLAEVGLPIAMACTYPDFSNPDAVQRRRELDYLRYDIAICAELGVKNLRVLAGQARPGLEREQAVQWAVEGLREAAATADAYGLQLVYEDHAKPGAWDYIDFSFPPDIFLEICAGLRGTSVGVNFDTANIVAAGWDAMPVLEQVADKICTVHVADTAEKGVFSPVLIGTGATPLHDIFAYLKRRGFDGWLCIEEASNMGLAGVAKAVENTRRLWEEA